MMLHLHKIITQKMTHKVLVRNTKHSFSFYVQDVLARKSALAFPRVLTIETCLEYVMTLRQWPLDYNRRVTIVNHSFDYVKYHVNEYRDYSRDWCSVSKQRRFTCHGQPWRDNWYLSWYVAGLSSNEVASLPSFVVLRQICRSTTKLCDSRPVFWFD